MVIRAAAILATGFPVQPRIGHSPRGSGTLAGVFLEAMQDRAFDGRVEVGHQFGRGTRRRCCVRSIQLLDRAALVRRLARERFVEDQPQRVEVALDRRLAAPNCSGAM